MIRLIILCLLVINFPQTEFNDLDRAKSPEEVEVVISSFFDAMRASDGEAIRLLVIPGVTLKTVTTTEGESILRETDFDDFIRSVSQSEPGRLDEQLTSMQIHVDGSLATAWMRYRFYLGEEFSHCGVNTMNLIRKADGWKIFSIVDTRRTERC